MPDASRRGGVLQYINTVEKTADRLKPVTQERHRLKSVVRALAGFSSRAREPRAIGPRLIACRPQETMVCPTAGGLAASDAGQSKWHWPEGRAV